MLRKIIHIDETLCNGCGLCVKACHEGAIQIVEGKAKLMRDDYCDGLGDCLPACPVSAIQFTMREAKAYDEAAVRMHKQIGNAISPVAMHHDEARISRMNWPIQIRLAPVISLQYHNADVLIAADCTAYAYVNFHEQFMRNHITLIGCPKLDPIEYADKLSQILAGNDIRSVHVVRMEVPCCKGMSLAVNKAINSCDKVIQYKESVITTKGQLHEI